MNYNLSSLLHFQNPTSGSKVMITVNQLLKQLITAVKQLLKICKIYNLSLDQIIEFDRLSVSWNSFQKALKTANNRCQTTVKNYVNLES